MVLPGAYEADLLQTELFGLWCMASTCGCLPAVLVTHQLAKRSDAQDGNYGRT